MLVMYFHKIRLKCLDVSSLFGLLLVFIQGLMFVFLSMQQVEASSKMSEIIYNTECFSKFVKILLGARCTPFTELS